MVGAYGLGEVLVRLEQGFASPPVSGEGRIATRIPSLAEAWKLRGTFARSSVVGVLCGIVPGAGATIASFVAYGVEGQYGKRRRQLGSGIPEGIVAPQVASTASVGGHMVPLLTLGIPGSGATAVILGAFLLHGVQPGPQIFQTQSALVYAIFASVFLGVIGMGLLGYFAIRPLIKVLYLPEAIVSVFVVLFCLIGAYSEHNNISDLWMIVVFGVVGYLFERWRFPIAPMVLGCILGPVAETSFLTTMISYRNDWTVFFTRPVSAVVMALTALALLYPLYRRFRIRRRAPPHLRAPHREDRARRRSAARDSADATVPTVVRSRHALRHDRRRDRRRGPTRLRRGDAADRLPTRRSARATRWHASSVANCRNDAHRRLRAAAGARRARAVRRGGVPHGARHGERASAARAARAARVPILGLLQGDGEADIRDNFERLLADGYRTVKVKVGFDVDGDSRMLALIQRIVAGRAALRVDATRAARPPRRRR
jgi:hypothetical protein